MSSEAYAAARESAVDIFITAPTDKPNVLSAIVGAGFIIDKSGYVVTCSHVAEPDGNRNIGLHDTAGIEDGLTYRVIARNDPMDIAVIKIDTQGRTLVPAKIGQGAALKLGDDVVVIGNPAGQRHSVAAGKLTALQANWGYQWGAGGTWHHDFLACNAPGKSGFSGGPLFNAQGEVVGMFSGTMTGGTEPVSFAIPIRKIMLKLPEILDGERPQGMSVGLNVSPLGPAEVVKVEAGSPAATAGLRQGDVITQIGDRTIAIGLDYYHALLDYRIGDQIRLRRRRNCADKDLTLTVTNLPNRRAEPVAGLLPGLQVAYYQGQWNQLPDFQKLDPLQTGVVRTIDVTFRKRKEYYALKFTGHVKVPQSGRYVFYSASDDGSRLYIGDRLVVDSDGLHGPTGAKGYISLEAGIHPLTVLYFQGNSGEVLSVDYEGPDLPKQHIPASALFHRPTK